MFTWKKLIAIGFLFMVSTFLLGFTAAAIVSHVSPDECLEVTGIIVFLVAFIWSVKQVAE